MFHGQLLHLNNHLRHSAVALKVSTPHLGPLCAREGIPRCRFEVPRAVIPDKQARDVLESEGFKRRVVREGSDLRGGLVAEP